MILAAAHNGATPAVATAVESFAEELQRREEERQRLQRKEQTEPACSPTRRLGGRAAPSELVLAEAALPEPQGLPEQVPSPDLDNLTT